MPIANVIRVSIIGSMPSGELWSVNPVWQIGGVSTSEDISADEAQTMATAIAAIAPATGILQQFSTSTTISGCRVEARRWDGTLAALAEGVKAAPAVGSGTSQHPFQTSIVSSLRTGPPGASGRGRLYWPATGIVIASATLRPANSVVSSFLSGVKTYLTSIGNAIDVSTDNAPVLSVWSRVGATTKPVTSIQAGDVLDTQRRRRDSLIEAYQSLSFP